MKCFKIRPPCDVSLLLACVMVDEHRSEAQSALNLNGFLNEKEIEIHVLILRERGGKKNPVETGISFDPPSPPEFPFFK
jgi:hypothetical protein